MGMISAFNCPNCGAAVSPDSISCKYCGSPIAGRVCPSCFGSVAVGMKHCPSCGAEVAESSSNTATTLKCPRCDIELSSVVVAKYSLHECMNCGGLWLDRNTFQEICSREEAQEAVLGFQTNDHAVSSPIQRKPRRAYIPCPECKKLMNTKNFSGCSGVVLDLCREHGSWFDKSELQKIITFIKNGGLRKAREREIENLKDREERLRMQQFEIAARERYLDSSMRLDRNIELNEDPFMQILSHIFSR
jgi:Zn-finger nucleic acid-binding protein